MYGSIWNDIRVIEIRGGSKFVVLPGFLEENMFSFWKCLYNGVYRGLLYRGY